MTLTERLQKNIKRYRKRAWLSQQGRAPDGGLIGHDSCDAYAAEKFILESAGMPDDWGTCKTCKGEGQDPATKAAYDAWKAESLPTGPGFQLWETISEGSPISPVFETLDALCGWAAKNASTFGTFKATAEQWRQMLNDNFVHHL